jgi:phage terminase large subunit
MGREYIIEAGSVHEQFLNSRATIQLFGGGFGNGKTAAMCVKAIRIINEYPGCNGLIARATYPKLHDTIRKEFKKWCPASQIVAFPESKNSDNTAKFRDGSMCNFRYIAQQGKTLEQSTSNQLSATYDWIIVDQIEDPEISEKDFYDLLGRLRGNAVYRGYDPTMPKSGPQFMMMSCNPSAGWVYKRIVRPLKLYQERGIIGDDLLCERDKHRMPILRDGKPILMVELFEAPTHANYRNLSEKYIRTLESTYQGQMYDRYLMGEWASYEGLVYPQWNDQVHVQPHTDMLNYLDDLVRYRRYEPNWVEGYDFGIAAPSCYLLAFVDPEYKVHIVDGFHRKEFDIRDQVIQINRIRAHYGVPDDYIFADPSVFRRFRATASTVGKSTPDLMWDYGKIRLRRGNNDIMNGILKVQSYLTVQQGTRNPYNVDTTSPMLYVSDRLQCVPDEMASYMWKRDSHDVPQDEPIDENDHSLDTIKYMLSDRPDVGQIHTDLNAVPEWMKWHVQDHPQDTRRPRYG